MENQKKQGKTPFIHPSLASGPAQRGKSRIAPGSQRGVVNHYDTAPESVKVPVVAPPDMEEALQEQGSQPATSAPALPPTDLEKRKNDVINKLLLFTQPLHRSVEISGLNFRFKMLTPTDTSHVSKILSSFPEDEQTILKNRILNLAASIVDVDGVSLESIYKGALNRDLVLIRYSELMKWSNPVLNGVLAAYEKLVDDLKQEYMPDFLKQPKKESTG